VSSKTLPILFIFKSNQNYMTLELNSKEKYRLIESIFTRVQRVDNLISLFQSKGEEKILIHYQDEKIILQELLKKLNYS
jgi:hypothetical protein